MSARERSGLALDELADSIHQPWQPFDVETVNDAVLPMARREGSFPWHHHDEDDLFPCRRGAFAPVLERRPPLKLEPAELYLVGRGRRHRPVAQAGPAYALLIEQPGTKRYGEEAHR